MKRPRTALIIAALKEARQGVLEDKKGGFICNNLPANRVGDYLVAFIAKAMTGDEGEEYFTLGNWVDNHITGPGNFPSYPDMKAYRLRWLDYMIGQLETK